jgi:hypothetical protein
MTAASQITSIPIQPSRILLIIILGSHSLAVWGLMMADVSWMLRIFLGVAVVLHAVFSYQRHYSLNHPDSVVQVLHNGKGWTLLLGGGSYMPATLGRVLITSFLTLLNFECTQGGRKYAVLLFPDTTDPQLTRRLRGWLRYGS